MEYRYGNDVIIFGGGAGQPQQSDELNELCQDVINIAKKYSAKLKFVKIWFLFNCKAYS